MLLTIDVGNTNTVLGVFDGTEVIEDWRIATVPDRTADEIAADLTRAFDRYCASTAAAASAAASACVCRWARCTYQIPLSIAHAATRTATAMNTTAITSTCPCSPPRRSRRLTIDLISSGTARPGPRSP